MFMRMTSGYASKIQHADLSLRFFHSHSAKACSNDTPPSLIKLKDFNIFVDQGPFSFQREQKS